MLAHRRRPNHQPTGMVGPGRKDCWYLSGVDRNSGGAAKASPGPTDATGIGNFVIPAPAKTFLTNQTLLSSVATMIAQKFCRPTDIRPPVNARMNWICCQIGAREHYAVARALDRHDSLACLMTDVWVAPNNPLGITRNLRGRFHEELTKANV